MTRWAGYGTKTAATPCGCPAPKWASRSAPRCRAWPLPSWVCRLRRCTCNYPAPATSPACAPLWAAKEAAAARGELHTLVTGQPLFAGDTRLPGLLYGRVLRAPVSAEITSRPQAWDETAARADPACVAVVQHPRLAQMGSLGLGIVARTPSALDRIEAALAVQWQVEDGSAFEQAAIDERIDIDTHLRPGAPQHP